VWTLCGSQVCENGNGADFCGNAAGTSQPMTVYGVTVWQTGYADNLQQ
jgi:hypothetical protein